MNSDDSVDWRCSTLPQIPLGTAGLTESQAREMTEKIARNAQKSVTRFYTEAPSSKDRFDLEQVIMRRVALAHELDGQLPVSGNTLVSFLRRNKIPKNFHSKIAQQCVAKKTNFGAIHSTYDRKDKKATHHKLKELRKAFTPDPAMAGERDEWETPTGTDETTTVERNEGSFITQAAELTMTQAGVTTKSTLDILVTPRLESRSSLHTRGDHTDLQYDWRSTTLTRSSMLDKAERAANAYLPSIPVPTPDRQPLLRSSSPLEGRYRPVPRFEREMCEMAWLDNPEYLWLNRTDLLSRLGEIPEDHSPSVAGALVNRDAVVARYALQSIEMQHQRAQLVSREHDKFAMTLSKPSTPSKLPLVAHPVSHKLEVPRRRMWRRTVHDPVADGRERRRRELMSTPVPQRLVELSAPQQKPKPKSETTFQEAQRERRRARKEALANACAVREISLPIYLHGKEQV